MSRDFVIYGMSPVADGLVVGALPRDEKDVAAVAAIGTSTVVNLVQEREYKRRQRKRVVDSLLHHRIAEFRAASPDHGVLSFEVIESAASHVRDELLQGHSVYLHCRAGWQRSVIVAAATLCIQGENDPIKALERVTSRRGGAGPFPHQVLSLEEWWWRRRALRRPKRP